ncbi:uncharacterized protein LOC117589506 [Drosophila guanche]|uniref:WAP domain-containing protein n=1 Tax=Drosophila guanche TaxID=7266 RepID=A0A3B0KH82_DROGU|nr:uncharacterized protein LOC117589506 [Drosophila guanche]SPP87800.1 Hypothetical predicted protein [Drosophila guanche]
MRLLGLLWLPLPFLSSLYLCIGYATATKVSTARGVAQYRLPLPAPQPTLLTPASEAAPMMTGVAVGRNDTRPGQARSPTQAASNQRRRTQIVRRLRPVSRNSSTTSTSTSTTSTTTTTTTTTSTTPRPSLANGFNFFNPSFWNFGQSSLVAIRPTTKQPHPPKKFSLKEEKISYRKPPKTTIKPRSSPTTSTTTTTSTTVRPTTDGPFRIALPTLTFASGEGKQRDKEKEKRAAAELRHRFNCPRENEVRFQLFPKICKTDKDCAVWRRDELCCDIFGSSSCVSGVAKPLEEAAHAPILGLIPRKCPTRPLAELWWDVQECSTDMDCWPRVCCPDGRRRYCRTSQPELETAPVPVKRSFDYLTEYLECTAPPPPIFDLHPKACTSTLDCFPNVCCQEAGLRHCRPPKKSVLTLMANFLNVDFVKRLTQNIVIK